MPITPLPQFEADLKEYLDERDREAYERLAVPKTIVVRFGRMKMVGEFPYRGDAKPGCGSKIVVRTHRGTEIGEMLTSTCPNAGCSKSVTRKEMLEYIENSGGRQYPFHTKGKALRVATAEDLNRQAALEQRSHPLKMDARARAERLELPMKIVEAEPILGGETLTFFFTAENRVDFRELVRELAAEHGTRIEMWQVGARDEARITADYERCGQYCCCKNFLKVLKNVPMKTAKEQKATLDPLKISGRCGRLMCCLRYEDQTYRELAGRLPKRRSEVGTPEGDGIVVDSQILTQLVLVRLHADGRDVAVPVEELTEAAARQPAPSGAGVDGEARGTPAESDAPAGRKRRRRRRPSDAGAEDRPPEVGERPGGKEGAAGEPGEASSGDAGESGGKKKRRRRRRRRRRGGDSGDGGDGSAAGGDAGSS